MIVQKKVHPKEKLILHPRNKHRERYDLKLLIKTCPELKPFVLINKFDDESIDFFNPEAVKMLNKALLKQYYKIDYWDVPKGYLCPPIPGRADYIHYIADLLGESNNGKIPTGNKVKVLDIGVGANCAYPIIGNSEYGWSFVGSEIDMVAISSANAIIKKNASLKENVTLRLQPNAHEIFYGIIQKDERFAVSVCNPPFHASLAEAQAGTMRKIKNLTKGKVTQPTLNFGGKNTELWTEGGEIKLVRNMIRESKKFADSCCWFTTLISKESNLPSVNQALKNSGAAEVKTIPMGQGNKVSRMVAWTFLKPEQRLKWFNP
jgi:23S rRNA (adenine1618-N6)-methyltransferase